MVIVFLFFFILYPTSRFYYLGCMVTIGILGPERGQETLERSKSWKDSSEVLKVHCWGETGCWSQSGVWDSRHLQDYKAFEEATEA